MTNIHFRYSYIYEQMMRKISGDLDAPYHGGEFEYVVSFAKHWEECNDKVFDTFASFGLDIPESLTVYFINRIKGIYPFSDPTTLIIEKDLQKVSIFLIHELTHVLLTHNAFSDNPNIWTDMFDHVQKVYPENSIDENIELVIIIIAHKVLTTLFDREIVRQYDEEERTYPSLAKAWQIIDRQKDILDLDDPMKAVLTLRSFLV